MVAPVRGKSGGIYDRRNSIEEWKRGETFSFLPSQWTGRTGYVLRSRPSLSALASKVHVTRAIVILSPFASLVAHPAGRRQLVHGVQDLCESTRPGLVAKGNETS